MIFGVAGACRNYEFTNLLVDHIQDQDKILVVKVANSKAGIERMFIITEGCLEGVNFIELYRKYARLRPTYTNSNRFFLNYKKGKCVDQVVGINTFGKVPKMVAEYLGLPDPTGYTGHCFRQTSLSGEAGAFKV